MEMSDQIIITDRKCTACRGPVTAFMIPDLVWDALGFFLDDWACLSCVANRWSPKKPPSTIDQLNQEIIRQRRRFKLKEVNLYDQRIPIPLNASVRIPTTKDESLRRITAEECTASEGNCP